MKKQRIIGTAIAFVALVLFIFLPIASVHRGVDAYFSLGECYTNFDVLSGDIGLFVTVTSVLLIFPLFGIVANLIGKLRVLAAWLMLIPFLWCLVPKTDMGSAVWVYGALTIVLIVYSMYMKIKSKKAVAN